MDPYWKTVEAGRRGLIGGSGPLRVCLRKVSYPCRVHVFSCCEVICFLHCTLLPGCSVVPEPRGPGAEAAETMTQITHQVVLFNSGVLSQGPKVTNIRNVTETTAWHIWANGTATASSSTPKPVQGAIQTDRLCLRQGGRKHRSERVLLQCH